jgi:uncharacterized protein YjeT (DUF2065 family)
MPWRTIALAAGIVLVLEGLLPHDMRKNMPRWEQVLVAFGAWLIAYGLVGLQ